MTEENTPSGDAGMDVDKAATALRALLTPKPEPKVTPHAAEPAAKVEGDDVPEHVPDQEATDSGLASDDGETAPVAEDQETEQDSMDAEEGSKEQQNVTIDALAAKMGLDKDTLLERAVFEVKAGGKTETVSLKELHAGYARETDYRSKTERLASEKRVVESRQQSIEESAREQAAFVLETFKTLHGELVGPEPDRTLETDDPMTYTQQVVARGERQRRFDAQLGAVAQKLTKAQSDAAGQFNTYKAEQLEVASRLVPELFTHKDVTATRGRLAAYLKTVGVTDEAMESIVYGPFYKVAYDALLYHEAKSGKAIERKKVAPTGKVLKPGAKTNNAGNARALDQLRAHASKTGTVQDVAALLAAKRKAVNSKGASR